MSRKDYFPVERCSCEEALIYANALKNIIMLTSEDYIRGIAQEALDRIEREVRR